MLAVVITGPSYEEALVQITQALPYADLLEIRCVLTKKSLKYIRDRFLIPMIFKFPNVEDFLDLQPEYIDIEYDSPLIETIRSTKIILSYHNFEGTPDDLDGLYKKMRARPADFYKIAVMANSCLDAWRFIFWSRHQDAQLIAISMGPQGEASRILAPLSYAAICEGNKNAPGQLTMQILKERYHYPLNKQTALYGLIGSPVSQSISDKTHNDFFHKHAINAVYLKIELLPHELSQFLIYAKELFKGLSVTRPYKEAILPYIDVLKSPVPAVNTLCFNNGKTFGFNTDGIGALNCLGEVMSKKILIIGTGGSAKAIAHEALARGAEVSFLAVPYGPQQALNYCAPYDILINCTPSSLPINPQYILPFTTVLDLIISPEETSILQIARLKNCRTINGKEMFFEQARGQFSLWFNRAISEFNF